MNYPTANKVDTAPIPKLPTKFPTPLTTIPPISPNPKQHLETPNDTDVAPHAERPVPTPHSDLERAHDVLETEPVSDIENDYPILTPQSEPEHASVTPPTTTPIPPPIQPTLYDLFTDAPIPSRHHTLPAVNEYCGDTMDIPKPPNTTRFTSQNHHHITVSPVENQVIQICRDQRKQASDVHAIQEHKLDHHKYLSLIHI